MVFSLLFLFNIESIDSNADKIVSIDTSNIHNEEYYKIYFKNLNSNDFYKVLSVSNIDILSYLVDDEIYYAKNINDLLYEYTLDKTKEEKAYADIHGIKIDGLTIICEVKDLIELDNVVNFY